MEDDGKIHLIKRHLICSGIKFQLDECLISNIKDQSQCKEQVQEFFNCAKKFNEKFKEKYKCKE